MDSSTNKSTPAQPTNDKGTNPIAANAIAANAAGVPLRQRAWPYWLTIAILAALYTAMYWLHPVLADDFDFKSFMATYLETGTWSSFWNDLQGSIIYHYKEHTGRIWNLIGSAILVVPKGIVSFILGSIAALNIWLAAKLVGIWRKNFFMYSVLAAMYVLFLPWFELMFTQMFALNYVVSSFILLATCYLFLNKRLNIFTAFLLGIVLGTTHEIFGGAAFCAIATMPIFYKEYRTKNTWVLLGGILISIFMLILAPGTIERSAQGELFLGFKNPRLGVAHGYMFYIYTIICLFHVFNARLRKILYTPVFIFCTAGAIGGWIIWRTFTISPRITWPMSLFSILGIAYLLKNLFISKTTTAILLGTIIWAAIYAHLASCIPWFIRIKAEAEEAYTLLIQKKDGVVYYDLTSVYDAPWYILGKPTFNAFQIFPNEYRRVLPTSAQNCINNKNIILPHGDKPCYSSCNFYLPIDSNAIKQNQISANIFYNGKPYRTYAKAYKMTGNDSLYMLVHPYIISYLHSRDEVTGIEICRGE